MSFNNFLGRFNLKFISISKRHCFKRKNYAT